VSRPIRPALLAALALAAVPVLGDYRSEFREGLRSLDSKAWAEAERHLLAAIAEKPHEDARDLVRLSGTFSKTYVPYFYLGVARFHLGRCAEALEAFDRSRAERVVLKLKEAQELDRLSRQCGAVVAREALGRLDDMLAEADRDRQQYSIARTRSADAEQWTADPALGGEQARLERLEAELRRELEAVREADPRRARDLEAPARELAAGWRKLRESAQRALAAAPPTSAPAGAEATPDAPGGAATRAAPERTAPAIPGELAEAARAYFAGDYRRCLRLLSGVQTDSPRLEAQVELLRGASEWSLSRTSPDGAARRLAAAAAHLRRARALDPALRPSTRYFAPPIVALVER
jgi:hypothetical protein